MSDSVRPHRRQPTRLPCPWDSPGKNTGVGCHFLLQCMKVKSEKWKWSRSAVSDSWRPHGLEPARLLCPWDFPGKSTGVGCHCEQLAMLLFNRLVMSDSSWPHVLEPARLLCPWAFPGKKTGVSCHFLLQRIFPTQGSNPRLLHCRRILCHWTTWEVPFVSEQPLIVLLSHWLELQWPSPMQAAVSEQPLVAHLANGRWSGGHQAESEAGGGGWGKRWRLGLQVNWEARGTGWGLCPAKLQSPGQGCPLALVQALRQHWTSPSSLSLWPNGSSSLPVKSVRLGPGYLCSLRSLRARWVLGAWLPQWWQLAQSGDLALREPPAEICLFLARIWTSKGESCAWGPWPFLS